MVNEDLMSKTDNGRYDLTEQGIDTFYKVFGNLPLAKEHEDQNNVSIDNALTEINGYLAFLEDFKSDELVSQKDQIWLLCERFKKLNKSVN